MLLISHPDTPASDECVQQIRHVAELLHKTFDIGTALPQQLPAQISDETAMLFLSVPHKARVVQAYLNACRKLRIPYVFLPEGCTQFQPTHVLVPVSFLEEEVEKGQFAAAFGRFCQARTTLLQAHDYGSRALRNVQKISTMLQKFELPFEVKTSTADSFKVAYEACLMTDNLQADLLILSASRDYGLDDLLFGPQERKVIMHASVPVMLVNPRNDIYSLCD